MSVTFWMGAAFLALGVLNAALGAKMWGYPWDEVKRVSAAPRWLTLLHRLIGVTYLILYVLLMVRMVPRLWQYGTLSPFAAVHAFLGVAIGVVLVVKLATLRFFHHFEKAVPALGGALLLLTVLTVALPLAKAAQRAQSAPTSSASAPPPATAIAPASTSSGPAVPPEAAAAVPSSDAFAPVAALLADRCTVCHSGPKPPKGLRLDTLDAVLASGVVLPGHPRESELIRRVRGESQPRMPMDGPPFLADAEVALLEQWIVALGAAPSSADASAPVAAAARPAIAPIREAASDGPTPRAAPAPGETVTYAHVRPILLANCVRCHAAQGQMGAAPAGLILSSWDSLTDAPHRPVVVPGKPGLSLLLRHVRGIEEPRMPFDGPPFLTAEDLDLLERWIAVGARDAEGNPAPMPAGRELRLRGILTARWAIDGAPFDASGAEVRDVSVGAEAEVRGTVDATGALRAERVRGR